MGSSGLGDHILGSFGAIPKGHEDVFQKRTSGVGGGSRPKPVNAVPESEDAPEALTQEKAPEKAKVKLTDLKWSREAGQFNEKIGLSVETILPEEYVNLTKIEFQVFAVPLNAKRELIQKQDGFIQDGKAAAEVTLFWPQYRENGQLLEKCDFVFTAKHRESDLVESAVLEVTGPIKIIGHVWVQFLSLKDLPLVDIECMLKGTDKIYPKLQSDKEGIVCWENVVLQDFKVVLKLGSNTLEQPVPWIQEKNAFHLQKIRGLEKLMGSPATALGAQSRLKSLGFDPGKADGIMGPKTKDAIKAFQSEKGLDADGSLTDATQELLQFYFGG